MVHPANIQKATRKNNSLVKNGWKLANQKNIRRERIGNRKQLGNMPRSDPLILAMILVSVVSLYHWYIVPYKNGKYLIYKVYCTTNVSHQLILKKSKYFNTSS